MTFVLRSSLPPRVTRAQRRASRSGGPVRVSASVLWSLHRKGTRCDDPTVVDLTAPLRSKRFITLSDSGGAAEDVALPGLAGVGRVELAIEEAAEEARRGEAELEEVGGTKGSERVRPRAALFLTDIGSEALVLVDGQPLAKRERRRLRPGSVLSFRRPSQQQEGGGEGGEEFFELFRDEKAHA